MVGQFPSYTSQIRGLALDRTEQKSLSLNMPIFGQMLAERENCKKVPEQLSRLADLGGRPNYAVFVRISRRLLNSEDASRRRLPPSWVAGALLSFYLAIYAIRCNVRIFRCGNWFDSQDVDVDQLNAELEHQTSADSTDGGKKRPRRASLAASMLDGSVPCELERKGCSDAEPLPLRLGPYTASPEALR
jgi:hypothetical protein